MVRLSRRIVLYAFVVVLSGGVLALPLPEKTPYRARRHYVCYRRFGALVIDGKLEETAWGAVPWTQPFVDILGYDFRKPGLRTRVKLLWDDEYLYVAAELEKPHVQGSFTEHDSLIFRDNDFEVFIDPDGDNLDYCEFEINALNTAYDIAFHTPYEDGELDRGWDMPGLRKAVHVDGTLNESSDVDADGRLSWPFPGTRCACSPGARLLHAKEINGG